MPHARKLALKPAKPKLPPLEPYRLDQPRVWDYEYQAEDAIAEGRPILKVPANLSHGIQWHDNKGNLWEARLRPSDFINGKRKVEIAEHTWVGGWAGGAMHYYTRLDAGYLDTFNLTQGGGAVMGGYGPEYDATKPWRERLQFSVRRRLTKVEKNMNDEPLGAIGDWTNQFDTPTAAYEAAIVTFKKFFGPGWVLLGYPKPEGEYGRNEDLPEKTVLAET